MAVTLTFTLLDQPWPHSDYTRQVVTGTMSIAAGGTYVTGGIPIPVGLGLELIKTSRAPKWLFFWNITTNGATSYVWDIINNTLRIFVNTAGTYAELGSGAALPASAATDSIGFHGEFLKNV